MEERREMTRRERSPSPQISDAEFDEILLRNKTVSSSAISRAVSDASTGMNLLNKTNDIVYSHDLRHNVVRIPITKRECYVQCTQYQF